MVKTTKKIYSSPQVNNIKTELPENNISEKFEGENGTLVTPVTPTKSSEVTDPENNNQSSKAEQEDSPQKEFLNSDKCLLCILELKHRQCKIDLGEDDPPEEEPGGNVEEETQDKLPRCSYCGNAIRADEEHRLVFVELELETSEPR